MTIEPEAEVLDVGSPRDHRLTFLVDEVDRGEVRQARLEAGRDPQSLPVTLGGAPEDPDMLKRFRDLGVVRVNFPVPPASYKVRIESAPDESLERSVVVRVVDTGAGISEGDAPHIFDRFYQGAGRSRGGTGLGLAFCKLAVELHGGTISVANPGKRGAVVQFTLPAAQRAPAAKA